MNPPQPDPRWPHLVAEFSRALSVEGRKRLGLFAIEGFRLIERALATSTPLPHVLLTQRDYENPSPRLRKLLEQLAPLRTSLTFVPEDVLEKLTEDRTLGPILALAKTPPTPDLSLLLAQWRKQPQRRKILVVEDMVDPGNVGALIRTAHALDVGLFLALRGADPFHPRSARTSMGSIFRIPILRYDSTDTLLQTLHKHQVFTIGATSEATTLLPNASFPNKTMALFIGHEGKGLSQPLRQGLDLSVAIPMTSSIDSFSVNAATAVILYAMTYPPSLNES
ncbi:MAG: TrmH family RNA methyltransferase [Aliarcobacter sp.]